MRVALTFDTEHPDRPHCPPGTDAAVVDLLGTAGVAATFFLQGRWVEAYPDTARRIAEDGHLVGNHSYFHARMPFLSDRGLRRDITDAEHVIGEITGVNPRPWFRCPFGKGADDERVLAALGELGYRHIGWNVKGFDWKPEYSAADVEREVVDGALGRGDGAVVVLHPWTASSLGALPGIIERLHAAGGTFVTVDKIITPA